MAMPRPRWRQSVGARLRGQQQFLEIRPSPLLQSPPLVNRHQHGRLHAPLGHDLWPFGETRLEELAEARLGILYLPCLAHAALADARVDEGAGAVLAFAVTLSRAASGVVTVDYATTDGSAHAGDDYTAASGTLTFQTGESSQTIEVAVLDDAHDEGEETLTLTLSNAAGGRLTDGEATGTIKNADPLPRALLARFGRTAAVHVVEHVEERIAAPRAPGVEGRFAGRALRRGMEREMALSFLNRLGGSAGAHPLGGDARRPLGGSPAGGMGSPLGTPGLAAGTPMGAVSGLGATAGPLGAAGPDGGLNGGGLLQMASAAGIC